MIALAAVVASLLCPPAGAVSSTALGNEDTSARSLSMGGVGVAQDVEPSAAFVNPAALPFIDGYNVGVGATLIIPDISYKPASGGSSGMETNPIVTPNFAVSFPILSGKLHAGLAVESPYGGDYQWSDTGPMKYIVTNAVLKMIDVTPSIGFKLLDNLSVGASLHYYDVFDLTKDAQVNETILNTVLGAPGFYNDGNSHLTGTGQKLGYGASIFYKPTDNQTLGLVYRSQEQINVTGNLTLNGLSSASAFVFGGPSYTTAASASISLPASVDLGYSIKPNKQWTLEADASWYGWSVFHALTVYYPNATAQQKAVLGTNSEGQAGGDIKNWTNSVSFGLGGEYAPDDFWRFRGGYSYQPAVGPSYTFNPEELDLTRHEFAIGTGMNFKPVTVDLMYMLIYMPDRTINNNVGTSGGTPLNGSFGGVAHLIALNLTKRF